MEKQSELYNRLNDLINLQQTLLFATATRNGLPELSVAPFVRDQNNCFYIYVSDLAGHTANLRANPLASVLFIRPEAESPNLFARERAIFSCEVREVTQQEQHYAVRLEALTVKFGETVKLLSTLPDFHLFAITPQSGRYIQGFGQAYQINLKDHRLTRISRSAG